MKRFSCAIDSITPLNRYTNQVCISLPDGANVQFKAGQYLDIILPSGKKCPFSIASSPSSSKVIELHIRPSPDSPDSDQIEAIIHSGAPVEIELPKGECFLETAPLNPLVLMAASTGVTQMKSILEHLLQKDLLYPVYLYWGALIMDDLYLDEFFHSWTRQYPLLHYVPVVSEPENSPAWRGRTGLLPEAVLHDFPDLDDKTFYVSGSPGMVYATLDSFMSKGMPRQNMYSDMFSLLPRE